MTRSVKPCTPLDATPGPWHVDAQDVCAWDGDIETAICECFNHAGLGRENRDANARLIAAAPDLLAACMALVEARDGLVSGIADRTEHAAEMARTAIKKAKGL